jgi:hypothetical protein
VGAITIKNFEYSAADDAIDISNSGWEAISTNSGTNTITTLDGAAVTTGSIVLQSTSSSSNLDVDTGSGSVLIVDGDFATTTLVEDALETSGTHEITLGLSSADETVTDWVIAWDDGTSTYIGVGAIEANSADTTTESTDGSTITTIEITTIVTLEGFSDVTNLVAANFGTNFIA